MALAEASVSHNARLHRNLTNLLICAQKPSRLLEFVHPFPLRSILTAKRPIVHRCTPSPKIRQAGKL